MPGGWLAARLPGWSFTNVVLIAAQRPSASTVAGYQAWQARGRQVRKGEPGIQVIAEPRPSPGSPAPAAEARAAYRTRDGTRAARRTYIWDITQTDGPPVDPALPLPHGTAPPGLWDALTWLARREGFAVERAPCGPADSLTIWSTRRVLIRPDLEGSEAAQALIHELGHVLAHDGLAHPPGASTAGCRGVRKVEADSIAFSDPRARPEETIRATGERITAAAGTIAAHLDVTLFAVPALGAAPAPADRPEPAKGAETAREHAVVGRIPAATARAGAEITRVTAPGPAAPDLSRVLVDAERFYLRHLERSWVPGYLATRGLSQLTAAQWRIGYAPAGRTCPRCSGTAAGRPPQPPNGPATPRRETTTPRRPCLRDP